MNNTAIHKSKKKVAILLLITMLLLAASSVMILRFNGIFVQAYALEVTTESHYSIDASMFD